MIRPEVRAEYITTIGIECHVQLKTKTKLFSGVDNDARDAAPNTMVSPICFGLPGTLPVLNKEAVQLAVRAGIALNADIAKTSYFERKHYFYPDLPKGYQVTQLARPVIGPGEVHYDLEDGTKKTVRIHHAHLEDDAGKLTHPGGAEYSLVDLNRAGTPLIEIVSEPDMHSPEEAKGYAQELYLLMTYAGVTHGDLYHGNMRFDVNVSVAKAGQPLGTRTETKNLNSFKAVERAVEFEVNRQIEMLEKGQIVVQETRGWNEDRQATFSQRSKEDAHDYRYFPDADIPPVHLSDTDIEQVRQSMPLLPDAYRTVFRALELDYSVINALLSNQVFGEAVMRLYSSGNTSAARRAALWITSATQEELAGVHDGSTALRDSQFIELAQMLDERMVSSTAAKQVFLAMMNSDDSPKVIAKRLNVLQVSDESAIGAIVDTVLTDPANTQAVADVKAGNDRVIGYLVGQVMKASKGKANPALAQKLIKERI